MRSFSLALLVSGFMLATGSVLAQAPASAPVAVPDQMAFDIPYGSPITADRAIPLVAAVMAEAKKSPRNWKLAVAVVDTNGDLVYFYKMENTMIASVMIAQYKARTAARYRRPSEAFNKAMQQPTGAYVATLESNIAASPGGIPIIEGGKLIGAIGCSGAAGIQDAAACKIAAGMLK